MFDREVVIRGSAWIFALPTPLDLSQMARLRKLFWQFIHEDGFEVLIIDLANIDHLDSSAISLLVATKNVVQKRRGRLALVGLDMDNLHILERLHLDCYFEIFEDVDEAIKGKQADQELPVENNSHA